MLITINSKEVRNDPDCVLLVLSCDAYSDLWRPYFSLLNRHWADCPFPVYLGSGKKSHDLPGVHRLESDGGRDWSKCVKDYLEHISTTYVLITLDDFFLRADVPTNDILYCLGFAREHDAVQLRLIPRPKPTTPIQGEKLIGDCERGSPYRLCTQAAIWNREKLLGLLKLGESIWEFEHAGNQRADAIEHGFYCVKRAVLPYQGILAHHVVEKGKWLPHERWIFSRLPIGCDFSARGALTWRHTLLYHAAQFTDGVLDILPWRGKQACKAALKKILNKHRPGALEQLGRPPTDPKIGQPTQP